ncbi:MAG TPA: C45 family autoproteolytic acyltransferase/hydrolase [Oscillatoriaceae cyanobacterium]
MNLRQRRVSPLALGLTLATLAGCGINTAYGPTALTANRDTLLRAAAAGGTREAKDGWIVVHVAGNPTERGQELGRLLAPEIRGVLQTVSQGDSGYWQQQRAMATKLFASKITPEYQAEMQGIADGVDSTTASVHAPSLPSLSGGAFAHVDYTDILALNSTVDLMFSTAPGRLMPRWGNQFVLRRLGWDGKHLPCSAFIATGAATKDGKIVVGHSTWAPGIAFAKYFNVLVDETPDQGHRFLMQCLPGAIASNTDWYLNDAGIVMTETTLADSGRYQDGDPIFERSREAIQYSNSIDDALKALSSRNDGDYPNEWLIGDMKTNEIAMFELATAHQALWRSGKQQWYNGQVGFYGGYNYAKDPGVRSELGGYDDGRGRIWANFYAKNKGRIDATVGRAGMQQSGIDDYSLDGKVADSTSVASLASWVDWGQPDSGSRWDLLGGAQRFL